jgi:pantoate ligase/cytidylate kinase
MILAIDGPAGAGKSTVAKLVASRLGLTFLDTGAMYRAVTLEALRLGLDPADGAACARVAASLKLEFDAQGKLHLDGRPGEPALRSPEVTRAVSQVSAHAAVRELIVAQQQRIATSSRGVVAEGRDTTTVVFPRADHKFFLTASSHERARRRALELGTPQALEQIRADIEERDRKDSTRAISPLVKARDAHEVITDGKSAEDVAQRLLAIVSGQAREGAR